MPRGKPRGTLLFSVEILTNFFVLYNSFAISAVTARRTYVRLTPRLARFYHEISSLRVISADGTFVRTKPKARLRKKYTIVSHLIYHPTTGWTSSIFDGFHLPWQISFAYGEFHCASVSRAIPPRNFLPKGCSC